MIEISLINAIRILTAISILSLASYQDYNKRQISPKYWPPTIALSLFLLSIEILVTNSTTILIYTISNLIIGSLVILPADYFNIFGRGDTKALLCLCLLIPTYPQILNYTPILPVLAPPIIDTKISAMILTIIGNTALIAIIYSPLLMLLKNYKTNNLNYKKPIKTLTSIRTNISQIQNTQGYITVNKDKNILKRISIDSGIPTELLQDYNTWATKTNHPTFPNASENNLTKFFETKETDWEFENKTQDLQKLDRLQKKDKIWIQYGIPLIIPLTISIIVSVFLGDMLIALIL